MQWIHNIFWGLALLGHVALCLAFYNRMHAVRLHRHATRLLEKACFVFLVAGSLFWISWAFPPPDYLPSVYSLSSGPFAVAVYIVLCAEIGLFVPSVWCVQRLLAVTPPQFVSNDTVKLDVAREINPRPIGNWVGRMFDCIPGNEMLLLHVHEKTFNMDSLPTAMNGLTIAHLSDLHFTGMISRGYFDFLIDQTIELEADVVAITGDIVDSPRCLEWIKPTLGRLTAPLGVYFILGNHEQRLRDISAVRRTFCQAGLTDLSGRVMSVRTPGGNLVLAGNERPWLGSLPDLKCDDFDRADFRVLLSHSPDQINWARKNRFDLMLAGHTHGGQVRFPLVGPILSPSNYGVKYAGGAFFEPPTLMHVTRGVSSEIPLRIRCAPELAKLVLVNGPTAP